MLHLYIDAAQTLMQDGLPEALLTLLEHACRSTFAFTGAHGRALTTAGCGVRALGFSSSSDSSSELSSPSSLLGGSMPAVAGCAEAHAEINKRSNRQYVPHCSSGYWRRLRAPTHFDMRRCRQIEKADPCHQQLLQCSSGGQREGDQLNPQVGAVA